MSDRELADRVVALGVGKKLDELYYSWGQQSDKFVRDWRVAGALMEKVPEGFLIWQQKYPDLAGMKVQPVWVVEGQTDNIDARNDSLPRAIIEACCDALENHNA